MLSNTLKQMNCNIRSFIVVYSYKLLSTYALLLIVDIAADVLVGLIVEELMLSLENEHQEIVHRKTFEANKIVEECLVDTYQTWWASEWSLVEEPLRNLEEPLRNLEEEPGEQVFVELMVASFHMMEHHNLCRPLVVLEKGFV